MAAKAVGPKSFGPDDPLALEKSVSDEQHVILAALRNGTMSIKDVAAALNVSRQTVWRYSKATGGVPTLGRPSTLPPNAEAALIEYINDRVDANSPLTAKSLKAQARQAARDHGNTSFMASRRWWRGFMSRHHALVAKATRGRTGARLTGAVRENVVPHYRLVQEVYEKDKYEAKEIYNMDQTSLNAEELTSRTVSVCPLRARSDGERWGVAGRAQMFILTSFPPTHLVIGPVMVLQGLTTYGVRPETATVRKGPHTTCFLAISAAGVVMPPFFVFKGQRPLSRLTKGVRGVHFCMTHNGWADGDCFGMWCHLFVVHMKENGLTRALLFLDGSDIHQHIAGHAILRRANVRIIILPPGTTGDLQPLDKTFIGPLKVVIGERISEMPAADKKSVNWAEQVVAGLKQLELNAEKNHKIPLAQQAFKDTYLFPLRMPFEEGGLTDAYFRKTDKANARRRSTPEEVAKRAKKLAADYSDLLPALKAIIADIPLPKESKQIREFDPRRGMYTDDDVFAALNAKKVAAEEDAALKAEKKQARVAKNAAKAAKAAGLAGAAAAGAGTGVAAAEPAAPADVPLVPAPRAGAAGGAGAGSRKKAAVGPGAGPEAAAGAGVGAVTLVDPKKGRRPSIKGLTPLRGKGKAGSAKVWAGDGVEEVMPEVGKKRARTA
jgi:hypothetical protein